MEPQISLEIAASIIGTIFKETAKGIAGWTKTQDFLNLAAKKYARNMLDEYSSIKVLGMTQPISLQQLYVTLNVLEKISARRGINAIELQKQFDFDKKGFGEIHEKSKQVGEVVNEHEKIIALGKPGAGKTTLLKYIANQSFAKADVFSKRRVPVFISLKPFAEKDNKPTLLQAIVEEFSLCKITDSQGFVEKLLEKGKIRLLLDGLDEVSESYLDRTLKEVKDFDRQYRNNQIIITCRTAAYNHYFEHFTDLEGAQTKLSLMRRFYTPF